MALLAGCDQPEMPVAGPAAVPPGLSQYVTGEAAAGINAEGLFSLDQPATTGDHPVITPERAGELALAYVRSFGPSLKAAWEEDRGAPIDLAALQVGSQVLYAGTPYGTFPAGYHPAFQRGFGPYYLVPLTSGGKPVLLISVAAYATQTTVDRRGFIQRPVQRGNEFVSRGLPLDTARFRLVSPEEAVAFVAKSTGARIARTPELVRVGMPYAPASAMWKLTLDREVGVGVGRNRAHARVREVYVGPERERRMMIPLPLIARSEPVPAIRAEAGVERNQIVDVPIREGAVVSFQPIVSEEGGA
ncbi:hypothetical protein [Longimicrobium sp.]|uniref:hypothetical protein n=1 Tax=Longimicrobium sp. TaxID=2029185 RepID=UPI002F95121E